MLLALATALAAPTIDLPPREDPAAWATAVALAGLDLGTPAQVTVISEGERWRLVAWVDQGVREAVVPRPTTARAREDVAQLAASLLRASPATPLAALPPVAVPPGPETSSAAAAPPGSGTANPASATPRVTARFTPVSSARTHDGPSPHPPTTRSPPEPGGAPGGNREIREPSAAADVTPDRAPDPIAPPSPPAPAPATALASPLAETSLEPDDASSGGRPNPSPSDTAVPTPVVPSFAVGGFVTTRAGVDATAGGALDGRLAWGALSFTLHADAALPASVDLPDATGSLTVGHAALLVGVHGGGRLSPSITAGPGASLYRFDTEGYGAQVAWSPGVLALAGAGWPLAPFLRADVLAGGGVDLREITVETDTLTRLGHLWLGVGVSLRVTK